MHAVFARGGVVSCRQEEEAEDEAAGQSGYRCRLLGSWCSSLDGSWHCCASAKTVAANLKATRFQRHIYCSARVNCFEAIV
jgi:hypothetical protein